MSLVFGRIAPVIEFRGSFRYNLIEPFGMRDNAIETRLAIGFPFAAVLEGEDGTGG